ncbi:MAG: hypothetical protein PHU24_05455 [Sphaerochaetaceae bacterium]|jgi:NDP-sugar pyrophosphorylase family protein|nr:hypothetical protein [Sphaerochaetaceae bacterium]MDD2405883.1 hypothetical protein [Sphaerochaetaceae bacterium]MDD4841923.1 hypothetical protein [Sphaerochaetaceae bacterium]MDX9934421.1 hypothetical protein [Sphaerochaetaceae bacterium]
MKPTLVVLAAGMGSRYGGVKQIDAVGRYNEALLDYSAFDAMKSGFGKVVFIIRKDIEKDFRERIFNRVARNFEATYLFQSLDSLLTPEQIARSKDRKKPWGTIHAILCAQDAVHEPFCVINADDYYGRDAFATMGRHLSNIPNDSTEHAMVGYVLRNTTSPSGSVSRAICTVKDGYLVSMRENTKIYHEGDRLISDIDGNLKTLGGDEWVSMNFFGFAPSVFPLFQDYFDRFLKDHITTDKAECYLPEGASDLVVSQKGRIRFYTTHEKWFGMTYVEDRKKVTEAIAEKIESGYYPDRLWD